ncbi:MAG: PAS domain S-box protein [Gammaproteobacteria bacterium]|nr:PAS domain S-box protein [Rhodocyclaceae bacterium]MBU3909100.1 PAS domain S-box protein [Gammaproteobacteria bacterium]MBU3987686.1 PAS domain S-box protein [Gammaproteobacteria bacterium]MBU4003311.1 PAS domain S-box protein [Gammaproteobacteria bacterium]MBU4022143.1 PAS domain S-box protein [Gammaproteobacteria bacterium]
MTEVSPQMTANAKRTGYQARVVRWIWAGCVLVVVSVSAVGWLVVESMQRQQQITRDLHHHPFTVAHTASNLRVVLVQIRNTMLLLTVGEPVEEVERLIRSVDGLAAEAERLLAIVRERQLGDPADPELAAALLGEWTGLRERIIAHAHAGRTAEVRRLVGTSGSTMFAKVDDVASRIASAAEQRGEDLATQSEKLGDQRIQQTWLLLGFLNLAVVLIAFGVVRRVARTLQREAEQRKMMGQQLADSEANLRAVIDATADAIIVITPAGLMESVNLAAERIFGYDRAELLGRNVSMLMPEAYRGAHDDLLAAFQGGGERKAIGFRRELMGQRKDGSQFEIELAVSEAIGPGQGSYVGVVRDISLAVRARRELEQMKRFMQQTLDALTASICVLDSAGTIIHTNRPWRRDCLVRGLCDKDGCLGADYLATSPATRDIPGYEGHLVAKALRRMLESKEDKFFAEYPSHGGEYECWMMLSATSFEIAGVRHVVVAHEDISELRGSQQALARKIAVLQTTLEAMRQGILMVDGDLNVVTVNRKYFQLMQLPPEFYCRKLSMPELIRYQAERGDYGPGDLEEMVRKRVQVLSQPSTQRTERTFPDGKTVEIFWRTLPVGSGAVATFNDITQSKQDELDLRQAKEAADAASEAKSAFLATMSHEIRTPLYGIIGMAELLETTALVADQLKMVQTVRDSGNTLLAIINDILDLSRIETGKLAIEATQMSLRETVQSVADVLAPVAEKKGIKFYVDISSGVLDHLIGDPVRVRQILFNLVGNAIKFTDGIDPDGRSGQVSLRVMSASADLPNTRTVIFIIEDNGIGMNEEVVSRIFQPFSQADNSMSRRYGGSGLGLSICARLVNMMGGEIDVTSHSGAGSIFTVRLPFQLAGEDSAPAVVPHAGHFISPAPTVADSHPVLAPEDVRLLVAEDNEINQELIRRQLAQLGYVADIVNNGREALDQLAHGNYDLLLTDCQMHEMDGYALAKAVRENESQSGIPAGERLPIIAFTANILPNDLQRCYAAGMDDVVGKPTELGELRRTLARWAGAVPATAPLLPRAAMPGAATLRTVQLTRLSDLIGPNPAVHARILNKFIVSSQTLLDEIGAAEKRADTATLGALGHKFKSSARAIGADALADACAALEVAGKGGDVSACSTHAAAIATGFSAAVIEIEAYLAAVSPNPPI